MLTEREIVDRLDRLEQPYRAMSQAIAEGVLNALKESGLTVPIQRAAGSDVPNEPEQHRPSTPADIETVCAAVPDLPGVCGIIGALPTGAIINEQGLARMLAKHPASIKAAVERGELPHPMRLMGKPTWTAGAIVKHFERRLESAEKEAERLRRIGRPRP